MSTLRFLVVDDNPLDCMINTRIISLAFPVNDVQSVRSPHVALEQIAADKDAPKTVLFVDVHMPLMNGFELISEIMKLPREIRDKYCIYMLSSSINDDDVARAYSLPLVLKYLNKPLSIDIVREVAAACI